MNKRLLLLWISALFLLAGTALAACGDDDDDDGGGGGGTDTTAAEVDTLKPGTLVVGVDNPYPPFEQGRPPDYEGFEIDLTNEIASRLGLETEYKDTPFDTIFRDLAQEKFDAAIAGSTILPEREKVVDFGDPWANTEQSLLVQEDSDIKTLADVEGEIVGAQLGTTGAAYAKDETEAEEVRTYDLIDDAFKALQTEQVAAVINDCPISKYAEQSKPDLQVVERIPTGENYGFAIEKGNDDLREAVNGALDDIKKDGTYDEIYEKWLGDDPCKSITAAE